MPLKEMGPLFVFKFFFDILKVDFKRVSEEAKEGVHIDIRILLHSSCQLWFCGVAAEKKLINFWFTVYRLLFTVSCRSLVVGVGRISRMSRMFRMFRVFRVFRVFRGFRNIQKQLRCLTVNGKRFQTERPKVHFRDRSAETFLKPREE